MGLCQGTTFSRAENLSDRKKGVGFQPVHEPPLKDPGLSPRGKFFPSNQFQTPAR